MPPAQSAFALKARHRAVFTTFLAQTVPPPPSPPWRALVTDADTHATLTALFTPTALRRHAITLHTLLAAPRSPIPDTPTVYILLPTAENVSRLLPTLHPSAPPAPLAFTTAASPALLAALAANTPLPSPISRVSDLHAHFLSLEHDLFALHHTHSYESLHRVASDSALAAFLSATVPPLLSLCHTLSVVPILRAQPGAAAEAVARTLHAALRDALPSLRPARHATRPLSFRRPLLLLLDRDLDLSAVLHHPHTYHALAHDLLPSPRPNTVRLPRPDSDPATDTPPQQQEQPRDVRLDKETDPFWARNAVCAFPAVAGAIEDALREYRAEVDRINRAAAPADGGHLAHAIASLPDLTRRKDAIDTHTNIATALLDRINARSLDSFFELERQIIAAATRPPSSRSADEFRPAVMELLKAGRDSAAEGEKRGSGTPEDRMRLFLIFYLVFGAELSEQAMAEFRAVLHAAGADTAAAEYVGKMKGFRHDLVSSSTVATAVPGTLNTERIKGIMTNVVNRGYRSFANVAQNAKKLIVEEKRAFAVTRTLELFMSEQARARYGGGANDILDGYVLLDPKVVESEPVETPVAPVVNADGEIVLTSRQKMQQMVFSDAIVFAVGGGSYVEYNNCVEMAHDLSTPSSQKNVLYGCTELVTPEDFLKQLNDVAKDAR